MIIIVKEKKNNKLLEQKIMNLLTCENIEAEIISSNTKSVFTFPGLTIGMQQVFCNEKEVKLTRIEYDLLMFFVVKANKVVTKEEIFKAVWGSNNEDTIKVVANTISNLRGKIEPCRNNPIYIQTVFGGYKFNSEIVR